MKRERTMKTRASRQAERTVTERSKVPSSNLFEPFFKVATPFIGLKTRRKRRGKRIIHKLRPLDRARSERKPFGTLASLLRTSGKTAKPFIVRLEQQLDKLYSTSLVPSTRRSAAASSSREDSPLRDKRDEIHRTAFYARPYR